VSQQEVIEALRRPAIYGLPAAETVDREETHGALVFLAGDRAYKLKRAVKYPYLDYSTPELRRAACRAELEVNRIAAPELYLGVKGIVRGAGGLELVDEEKAGDALDWVLVMRRFEQDALLEQMRINGRLTPELMRELAEIIADFHTKAERRPAYGGADATAKIVEGNIKEIEVRAGKVFDRARVDALARLSWAAIDRLRPLLDRRRADGFVRRCHGDMHLNNICVVDGKPTLFDAIEFDESFASIDVLYDLAFLLMDLDRHDLRAFANVVLNRYLERTADYGGLAALPLFLSCRAAIRAHVTVTRAEAMHSDAQAARAAFDEARSLLDQAIRYLEPPAARLVCVGGVSGTGKSTVARALAPHVGDAPGAVILRSDVTRKRLMGVDETTKLPQAGYSDEVTAKVFGTLAETARAILAAGHSVILDAVYGDPALRAQAEAAARAAEAHFDGIWLEAPVDVLEQRITDRRGDASDATVDVLRAQMSKLTPPADWTHVQAGRHVDQIVGEILRRLESASH
jgi:uncharacterized protein